jgi:glycosyltransferase involved in cell wall biosynthesis
MLVSVVICTWNRAHLLDATLQEMRKLTIPANIEWELLVVNNNCSDATDEVISRHMACLPIHRLFEPKQGLSHARNHAVDAANGELILWTDDDVLVDSNWLAEYVKAVRNHPEAIFFGGRINPLFSVDPPRWLATNQSIFSGAYALKEPGANIFIAKPNDDIPIGANMALCKHAFADFRFDSSLGRCGKNFISGEEAQLFRKLLNTGCFGIWVSSAQVWHHIPPARLTRRYIWNYYRGYGESQARMRNDYNAAKRTIELAELNRKFRKKILKSFRLLFLQNRRWAVAFQTSAITKGMIDALHAQQFNRQQS